MAGLSFVQQGNNGNVHFTCEEIPEHGFIDAVKVRDICKIKMLTRQERAERNWTQEDVMVKSATGQQTYINRKQLVSNYTHIDGKKITIPYLKSGKVYTVCSNISTNYKVMKLPNNATAAFNGSKVQPGSYIICATNQDGSIDKNSMTIVSDKMFRKMFKIPMQDVIQRNMGRTPKKRFGLFEQRNRYSTPARRIKPRIDTSEIGMNPNNINIPTKSNPTNIVFNKQSMGMAGIPQSIEQESKYKYRATHRIVDMSSHKLLGFVIQEIKTGKQKQFDVPNVTKMCEQHMVENLMLVRSEKTGIRFLKGNGMRIESLPEVIN
jgi:hypothetical protein